MRRYSVHKIFGPTIQGEGAMAGVPCVFVRFSGCNMWDGRLETRADSRCPFCDTDFFEHRMMSALDIVDAAWALRTRRIQWLWLSGGEPLLQLDRGFMQAAQRFRIAIETNGTVYPDESMLFHAEHVTMSPKVPMDQLELDRCDTLKVLWPHPNSDIKPEAYVDVRAKFRYVQPIDTGDPVSTAANVESAVQKVISLGSPWRLSVQTHKLIGVE